MLDKHPSDAFSLRDTELLAVFARQAAVAIEATRVGRESARLLRTILVEVGTEELTAEQLDLLVSAASAEMDREDDAPFWALVDEVARLRGMADSDLALVADILGVVSRHRAEARRGR